MPRIFKRLKRTTN